MSEGYHHLLAEVIDTALKAGHEILQVYNAGFHVEFKNDSSPLTEADKSSHKVIQERLKNYFPVLSEEGKTIPFEERKNWNPFWMVDPLDGTKEFIKRNGEFTVNIALVENQIPVLGVVYAPALNKIYFGEKSKGSFKAKWNQGGEINAEDIIRSAVSLPINQNGRKFTVVASRSHLSSETEKFIDDLKNEHGDIEFKSSGSSLKLCLVAEGAADVYPRLAPTMEWDTAAGQAVVMYAGKAVLNYHSGKLMQYNKPDLLNEWFVVK
ncbi:MAG: 3'(2'),5'-bisphosphate nucleotidase CysQ [Bacteroidia bacterium]|nr:3'(2'),5'-bisphosphate nucleotidase CysQ [Bacteroidia bacterium]